jgi:hypothetical protein
MIAGRSFLYQARTGTVYHVNEKGVQVIGFWPPNEHIVAFVDGDKNGVEPDAALFRRNVRIILASSPRVSKAKWKKDKHRVSTIAIKLWSECEFFITGLVSGYFIRCSTARLIHFFRIFLHHYDIPLERLRKSTSYFGYNPRLCFGSAFSEHGLHRTKEDVASQIRSVDFKQSNMLQMLNKSRTGDSTVSHSIFTISPKNDLRHLAECEFDLVSKWAWEQFAEVLEQQEARGHYLLPANFKSA